MYTCMFIYINTLFSFEMNEWVDAICTHLRLRNDSVTGKTVIQSATMPRIGGNDNIYGSGGIVCASQYGTLYSMHTNPTLSPNTFSVGSPSVSVSRYIHTYTVYTCTLYYITCLLYYCIHTYTVLNYMLVVLLYTHVHCTILHACCITVYTRTLY